jgi:hypothetical protein
LLLYYYEAPLPFTTTKPYIENNLSRPWARTIYRSNYRTHSRISSSFFFSSSSIFYFIFQGNYMRVRQSGQLRWKPFGFLGYSFIWKRQPVKTSLAISL